MSGAMDTIEILVPFQYDLDTFTNKPAIWETEPKESVDLDIYYQASGLIPLTLNEKTNEEYIPLGSTFTFTGFFQEQAEIGGDPSTSTDVVSITSTHTVTSWSGSTINFTPALPTGLSTVFDTTQNPNASTTCFSEDTSVTFTVRDYYEVTLPVSALVQTGASSMPMHGGVETTNPNHKLEQLLVLW